MTFANYYSRERERTGVFGGAGETRIPRFARNDKLLLMWSLPGFARYDKLWLMRLPLIGRLGGGWQGRWFVWRRRRCWRDLGRCWGRRRGVKHGA
jgi:hypothetical protein